MTNTIIRVVISALEMIVPKLPGRFAYGLFAELCKRFNIRTIVVDGDYGWIFGDPVDRTIMGYYAQNKTWSNEIVDFIRSCFSNSDGTFLDIGANIGLITLPISYNKKLICKCFEPDPHNFEFLKRNIRENSSHGNIDTFNVALFDKEGSLEFELSPENFGDHRIRASSEHAVSDKYDEFKRKVISVRAAALDAVIDPGDLHGRLIAKIDTQGSEAHIMKGGSKVLSAAHMIVFEFWPYGLVRMDADLDFMFGFLGKNFKFGTILETDGSPPRFNSRKIDEIIKDLRARATNPQKTTFCDVIVCKEPLHQKEWPTSRGDQ